MERLRRAYLRVRAIVARRRLEREMKLEMRSHIEQATERLARRGLSAAEARHAAMREFGNVGLLQEQARDARGARWIGALAADVRFALRYFARKPLTTTTIVLVLALGIGVNSALFSVIQSLTLRPAPGVVAADGQVRIIGTRRTEPGGRIEMRSFAYSEVQRLAARSETFSAVAAWASDDVILDRGDAAGPRAIRAQFVTPDFFTLLGIETTDGPGLQTTSGGHPVLDVVVSDGLRRQLFGDEERVFNRVLRLNDSDVRIVGVAPERFQGAIPGAGAALWLPMSARADVVGGAGWLNSADSARFDVFARLAPDVSRTRATTVAAAIATQTVAERNAPPGLALDARVIPMRGVVSGEAGPDELLVLELAAMSTIGLLILLVACANVSSLLVAAAVGRRHEIAVRLSLGASRSRVIRQLLTESALLAVTGGISGLLLYRWIITLVAAQIPELDLAPDLATLAFTLVFALATGILFGLSPALHATRTGVATAMRESGAGATRGSRLQRGFVIAQIALTQPLLVSLAVMLSATANDGQRRMDRQITSRVVSARFRIVAGKTGGVERQLANLRTVEDRISTLPGVEQLTHDPGAFAIRAVSALEQDRPAGARTSDRVRVHLEGTEPGYFTALEIPIVRGRDLVPADTAGDEMAVVIGSDLARSLWGSADPLGKRLQSADWRNGNVDEWRMVVVGVFPTEHGTTRGSGDRVYTAHGSRWPKDELLVRTTSPARTLVPAVQAAIRQTAPDLPVLSIETLAESDARNDRDAARVGYGVAAAAALALLLASIGLYAVVSLAVGSRQREIGIRMALGGRPNRVAGMFFASGVRLSVTGMIVGLPISLLALRTIAANVIGPDIDLPRIGAGIALVLIAVASAATWFPARRAAAVDPARPLRSE